MDVDATIARGVRSLASLAPAVVRQEESGAEREAVRAALARGYFTPDEEERLRSWFARYLTARAALLETIDELRPLAVGERELEPRDRLRAFAVAYAAACLLVRGAGGLVGDLAADKIVQRKLNEAAPRYRIPRKQYTAIHRSLTSPANAWRLLRAMEYADENRRALEALASEPELAPVVALIERCEDAIRLDGVRYARARARYRWHSWRRRRASASQQALFRLLEVFGRVVADVRAPGHVDRLSAPVRAELAALLEPGDVLVTRHDNALSNLFLPGYWPHAAVHVGPPSVRETLALPVPEPQRTRWRDPLRVLEARKDGVLFRAIDDTLAVDAVAVLRPRLARPDLARALLNAIAHEGKLYNFDFDFFTDERLVCTEVVYRAFEGVGGISFRLVRRSGRLTLSAEDLVDMALERRGFEPVAVFGTPPAGARLVTGDEAPALLRPA